jgi:hypothetical protein
MYNIEQKKPLPFLGEEANFKYYFCLFYLTDTLNFVRACFRSEEPNEFGSSLTYSQPCGPPG